eukprot:5236715-Pyramimonas_sp.AAC.1
MAACNGAAKALTSRSHLGRSLSARKITVTSRGRSFAQEAHQALGARAGTLGDAPSNFGMDLAAGKPLATVPHASERAALWNKF